MNLGIFLLYDLKALIERTEVTINSIKINDLQILSDHPFHVKVYFSDHNDDYTDVVSLYETIVNWHFMSDGKQRLVGEYLLYNLNGSLTLLNTYTEGRKGIKKIMIQKMSPRIFRIVVVGRKLLMSYKNTTLREFFCNHIVKWYVSI